MLVVGAAPAAPPTISTPCIPACRCPGIGQKNVYLPAVAASTLSVALAPGAIAPVFTTPEGVCTASACVTAPMLLTVIVIVPVCATLGVRRRDLELGLAQRELAGAGGRLSGARRPRAV